MGKTIKCRICLSDKLNTVISLGSQKITSFFPKYGDINCIKYRINLILCSNCGLLQLDESTPSDSMYKSGGYGYRSSISNTMRNHLKNYNFEVISKVDLLKNDVVVDIGSNDATTLKFYNKNLRRIGVDPTGLQFKDYYTDDIELLPDYFTLNNFKTKFGNIKAKVVTSISMFYDLPQPVQFAKDIYDILDDNGIWTCEQSYLLHMLDKNSLDTICHEHLEYYALKQINDIGNRANLKIIDVNFNDCNGGSFRIYFSKKESTKHQEAIELIDKIIKNEEKYNLNDSQTYEKFQKNCDFELTKLTDFINYVNLNNKTIQIYGASTKGNCILQYCNIGEKQIRYAVERNHDKIGLSTSTGIEIISEETMRKAPPDYLLVLPWHFKKEIIARESKYLNNNGQLIFYFPTFEIISLKPKLLITGCDGFIASYVKETFNEYCLYGITRTKKELEKNITKIFFDINDNEELENVIKIVNPENIVHLAGISSSVEAFENPIKALENNGMLTAKLCDIILRNNRKTKLFNASSSEIYKGHETFNVNEYRNIDNTLHLHPYSIAKIMGQNIIKFYRETYNLHLSNGIIFTTQSERKSDKFLLNKIYNHLKKRGKLEPITVGSLDSYRNIIHPYDVVSGIKYILNHDIGNDYNICNYNSHNIKDLVFKLYDKLNIKLIRGEEPNTYYDKETNNPLLMIKNSNNGLDNKIIDIRGYPCKLRDIDWHIKYSIEDIMNEILS